MAKAHSETMQCMEVWGGNQPVDTGMAMTGLEAWVYCRPYAAVGDMPAEAGGDVYFVSSCATGRITRLLVADVSGHGTAVSDLAGSLRQLMRRYVNYLDPRKFVGEMNRKFTELSENGCFATAVVTTFFSPTNHVTFCNAGHPAPLLYRAGKGWSYMESDAAGDDVVNLPLGIEDSSAYNESSAKLGVGDMVLCYTDGLPESRGADGQFLGTEGLLGVAQKTPVDDPRRVVPELLKAIADLYPGNLANDDITVLLFRSNGQGVLPSFFSRALGPIRLLKSIVASFLPGGRPVPWPDFSLPNVGGAIFSPLNRRWKKNAAVAPK